MPEEKKLSIYIHVPFCRTRCNYCDFNTYAGMDTWLEDYVRAVVKEIELGSSIVNDDYGVQTIYFGGGTPTLMQAGHFGMILDAIHKNYRMSPQVECTTEANPLLLSQEYLADLRELGINRLSLGMQSANPEELALLGRKHRTQDVLSSVAVARWAGFKNLNLDLMFGIPRQSLASLKNSVGQALDLNPEHLSIYSLNVEEGTPLERMIREGTLPSPDEDLAASMYEWLMQYLDGKGYSQYEISNWAIAPEYRSEHNLQYWHYLPYLGFGAGAHSLFGEKRWANAVAIPDYIKRMKKSVQWSDFQSPAAEEVFDLSSSDRIQERMMMGLRLVEEGVSERDFEERFGNRLEEVYQKEIEALVKNGLLEKAIYQEEPVIRLTLKGRMLGNQVFMQFLEG